MVMNARWPMGNGLLARGTPGQAAEGRTAHAQRHFLNHGHRNIFLLARDRGFFRWNVRTLPKCALGQFRRCFVLFCGLSQKGGNTFYGIRRACRWCAF